MIYKVLLLSGLCVLVAGCGAFQGSAARGDGTSGASGRDYTQGSGSSLSPAPSVVIGGIDNGMYPGADRGAVVMGGSSGGLPNGPPGGIANNQLDRIGL